MELNEKDGAKCYPFLLAGRKKHIMIPVLGPRKRGGGTNTGATAAPRGQQTAQHPSTGFCSRQSLGFSNRYRRRSHWPTILLHRTFYPTTIVILKQ